MNTYIYIYMCKLELLNHINKETIIRSITVLLNRAFIAEHTDSCNSKQCYLKRHW
jgi:hypothetical protein